MKCISNRGNRLLRILVNEIGVTDRRLLNYCKGRNSKIGDKSFEISLIENTEENYLYLYGYRVGFDVYLDTIQYIALFLKDVIQNVLIDERVDFDSILCEHFPILNILNLLDSEFFSEFIGGCRLTEIFYLHGEYILQFTRSDELTVIYFSFPCSKDGDNYIKVRIDVVGELRMIKIISDDNELIGSKIMKFLKDEIHRKE